MMLEERLENFHWPAITEEMNIQGYSVVRNVLKEHECDEVKKNYSNQDFYRKTIVMERYRFGSGEYKYFKYPLPDHIQKLRENIYPKLAPIANHWMKVLNINSQFPPTLQELHQLCRTKGQVLPTVLILQYRKGGHNTLHQDLYGEIFFPIQLVLFLSEPEVEYEGGEFILLEQRPRAQSKAIVLRPKKGDMLIFTTNFRPVKGSKGYFRVNMKHGVSELMNGSRYTLGIIFHDAQ